MIDQSYTYRNITPNIVLVALVWLCAFTVHIPTGILYYISFLKVLERIIFFVVFTLVGFFWLIGGSVRKNRVNLLFMIYSIVVLAGTIINDGSLSKAFYELMVIMVYFMLITISIKSNFEVFWKHTYYSAVVLLGLNVMFWILHPLGVNAGFYFFDTANESPNYILPLLAIVIIQIIREKNSRFLVKMFNIAIIGFNTLMLLSIDCSTGKVAICLFLALILFHNLVSKTIEPKVFLYIFFALLIIIVGLNLIQYFSFLIVDILGESLTLHTRTFAWAYAREAFKLHPIIGKGYLSKAVKYSVICEYTNGRFSHSHCEFWEIMLRSGIIGTGCLTLILTNAFGVAKKNYKNSFVMQVLVFVVFTFLIMSINETCFRSYFYLCIALIFAMQSNANEQQTFYESGS